MILSFFLYQHFDDTWSQLFHIKMIEYTLSEKRYRIQFDDKLKN